MIRDILFALWFFLPAGIANASPVFSAQLPGLRRLEAPLDFHKTFRGQRIFGSHKTWRGLLTGMLMSTLVLWLQQLAYAHWGAVRQLTGGVNYGALPLLALGPLFGLGALGGDAIESFFKRQHGIKPGGGWFPFDQTDYIIGGALVSIPFVPLRLIDYLLLLGIWLGVHIISTTIAYWIGLKDSPI